MLPVDPASASFVLTFDEVTPGALRPGDVVFDSTAFRNDAVVIVDDEADAMAAPAIQAISTQGGGVALSFPEPCETPENCLRSILETPDDPSLDPGSEAFEVGARLLLPAERTTTGSNVVQKGFSTGGGSQWKLQVDDVEGRPSCVLVGQGEGQPINIALSDVSIADGAWHDVICRRQGDTWTISVDGVETTEKIDAGLVVETDSPLRVGGKNAKVNNDPFAGQLDHVWVTLR